MAAPVTIETVEQGHVFDHLPEIYISLENDDEEGDQFIIITTPKIDLINQVFNVEE